MTRRSERIETVQGRDISGTVENASRLKLYALGNTNRYHSSVVIRAVVDVPRKRCDSAPVGKQIERHRSARAFQTASASGRCMLDRSASATASTLTRAARWEGEDA